MDEYNLGELATLYDSLHKTPKAYTEDGFPMIRVTDVKRGFVALENVKYVDEETYLDFSKKHKPQVGDIIYARVGNTYGKSSFVEKANTFCLGQNLVCITPDQSKVDPFFLYSFLNSENALGQMRGLVAGGAQPTISLKSIKEIKLNLPSLTLQVATSNALKNYDNLIENNNRRIAILEDMAQSLYREWFVNFRYPNHKDNLDADGNPKLVDSPLGQIPEGWEVKRLDDIASVNPQSITKKNAPDEIGYIDIKSVGTGTINEVKPMSFDDAPSRARRVVVDGDIIWATVRPNRKQYSFICKPASNTIASTGFAVLRSKSLPASYLYSFTTTDSFTGYLVNHATGSAYPAVNADIFKKADVLVPPLALVQKFDEICSDAISQSEVLKKKNKNLKQQRDMLLPKLISGQIKL